MTGSRGIALDSSISHSEMSAVRAVFALVRSEYWTADISRYRLAISRESLVASLQAQTADFQTVLQCCPADPFWSERIEAFQPLNPWPWWELKNRVRASGWPYLLVELPDDLILPANAIERLITEANAVLQRDNGNNPFYLNCLTGAAWDCGVVRPLGIDVGSLPIRAKVFRSKFDRASFKVDIEGDPIWYQPVHQEMDCSLPAGWDQQPAQDSICIEHVSRRILSMYSRARLATATAEHATAVLPRRTKSMYFLQQRRGRRR